MRCFEPVSPRFECSRHRFNFRMLRV
ncbi:hypothetical protein GGP78_001991 [Salinibacter ruber]|nr:hypothetical protein [Salinibacter ruber]